jgi:hypothetical protein
LTFVIHAAVRQRRPPPFGAAEAEASTSRGIKLE